MWEKTNEKRQLGDRALSAYIITTVFTKPIHFTVNGLHIYQPSERKEYKRLMQRKMVKKDQVHIYLQLIVCPSE